MNNGFLSVKDAAKRMGCVRQWVNRLIENEELKAEKVGGVYILKTKHVEAYMAAHPPKKKKKKKR